MMIHCRIMLVEQRANNSCAVRTPQRIIYTAHRFAPVIPDFDQQATHGDSNHCVFITHVMGIMQP